ncbi:unnamed protein product [Urochloa humidicola]
MKAALQDEAWVQHIRLQMLTSAQHFGEFTSLWAKVQRIALRPEVPDQIVWKLSADGEYSAKSAYEAQFLGATNTRLDNLIWKVWAPPKCKFFGWLAYQNRLWTADRLDRRGWPNQKKCPLCRHTDESALHLFAHCRYTRRVWSELRRTLSATIADTAAWKACRNMPHWWKQASTSGALSNKATRSLLLLVSWEIWKERNARIFQRKEASVQSILMKIKDEIRAWCLAGCRCMRELQSGD